MSSCWVDTVRFVISYTEARKKPSVKLDSNEQQAAKNVSDMVPLESFPHISQREGQEEMKQPSVEVISKKSESRVIVLQDQAPP